MNKPNTFEEFNQRVVDSIGACDGEKQRQELYNYIKRLEELRPMDELPRDGNPCLVWFNGDSTEIPRTIRFCKSLSTFVFVPYCENKIIDISDAIGWMPCPSIHMVKK